MTFNAIAAVQSLTDEVARRAPEIESVRRLPADLAQKMAQAGLFRMLLPAALGGHDTPPAQIGLAIETLAQADASAAWCLMIGATTAAMANRMPAGMAREVFGHPEVITAGVFAPMGKAVDDGDDWVVTGRWQWGSGSQNASWIAGGAVLMGPDGPLLDEDGRPLHRMMIFPAAEVELLDTWRTSGLCGTGSLDFQVKDLRVPKARSVALQSDPVTVDTPLARFPIFCLLALGVTAVALGNARGALLAAGNAAQTKKAAGSHRPRPLFRDHRRPLGRRAVRRGGPGAAQPPAPGLRARRRGQRRGQQDRLRHDGRLGGLSRKRPATPLPRRPCDHPPRHGLPGHVRADRPRPAGPAHAGGPALSTGTCTAGTCPLTHIQLWLDWGTRTEDGTCPRSHATG